MDINVIKTGLKNIMPLRALFLQENNIQIRYNACHERGWSDSYIVTVDNIPAGYGSIKGKENHADRNTVFEFFIIPVFRKMLPQIFRQLLSVSGAVFIECQSNDFLLSSMLYEFAQNIFSEVVLFADHRVTNLTHTEIIFRQCKEGDIVFEHKGEPEGDYVLVKDTEIIATGGYMLHYNMPFADLYMEVNEQYRRKGYGSYLIQELKKECYSKGRVPAARCNIGNTASKATLIKAGLEICGYMLSGDIKPVS
jgi:GNAT superfamily N-acetyltransferase